MIIAGHKISKKWIITAVIVLFVALCGIIVYNTNITPKMHIGNMYNGLTLRVISEHSDKYAEYDIREHSKAEREIAEKTNVIVIGMTLTDANVGIATLKITSLDLADAVKSIAKDVSADSLDSFKDEVLGKLNVSSLPKRETVEVTVAIQFVQETWIITPTDELFNAITGNVNPLIEDEYNK